MSEEELNLENAEAAGSGENAAETETAERGESTAETETAESGESAAETETAEKPRQAPVNPDFNPNKKEYIDETYQLFAARVIGALANSDFYQFFIENLEHGSREYQFSNRKLEKTVDTIWVDAVEKCIDSFANVIANPRNFIREDEEIVNVAVARQSTPDVIRHLTTHGNYIDEITDDNVRPNHLMNKFKEDSWNTYENRFVYTLLEKTIEFVRLRYDAIFANMGDEFGAFLKVDALSQTKKDSLKCTFDVRVKQLEENLEDGDSAMNIYNRIQRIKDRLDDFDNSKFSKQLRKYPRVKNPIVKTNAIQKNPNFKGCYVLWEFLYGYHDVGYEIHIYEQDTTINPEFERDIENNIFFQYMILKNHLQNKEDREIDTKREFRSRTIRPRVIKQIVEEIVKNYDVKATEVRKILIDELNKQQLMEEEARDRQRLVEEKKRREQQMRRDQGKISAQMQKDAMRERARRIREENDLKAARTEAKKKYDSLLFACIQSYRHELESFEKQKTRINEKRMALNRKNDNETKNL